MASWISSISSYIQSYSPWGTAEKSNGLNNPTASKIQKTIQTRESPFPDLREKIGARKKSLEEKIGKNFQRESKLISEKVALQEKVGEISRQILEIRQNNAKLQAQLEVLKEKKDTKEKPRFDF